MNRAHDMARLRRNGCSCATARKERCTRQGQDCRPSSPITTHGQTILPLGRAARN